mmetsp:Transcript_7649/g.23157  ORF Transcript_7649/g.23157 Transcript_7649/m.23157 type:complete len:353 (-) Transcript_7649:566-1624(-)|eukprot:CAMPEP_0198725712 /NCGR_PEP_ID=MMETSP1475-20131203/2963_1 /TAXON_ID= ORGANISM="Unidentified sp., Strain CCMP1999" /NCGR_SAMPLE_ID=MMETSP1475 /ASSEMBLY_ACC=CAM_ASM_001111 /LENGTH=352 /DNA_ID=CAMNT_0044487527 /DNA_START=480 /DNA_END=1538 /DNA_ORIENTATION=+
MTKNLSVIIYSAEPYEVEAFEDCKRLSTNLEVFDWKITHLRMGLSSETVHFASGYQVVCLFVNDKADAEVLLKLAHHGVRLITIRGPSVGNVDVRKAAELGLKVCRVPAGSQAALNSVAEYTVGLMLTLNRKTHAAYTRTRDSNFLLNGFVGFEMSGKTVGLVGTGKVAVATAKILKGFDCKLLAYDVFENQEISRLGGQYVPFEELLSASNIVSLHAPSLPATYHLINAETINLLRPGAMIINTCRGSLMDMPAVLDGLKSNKIGALGVDVYEKADEIFYQDHFHSLLHDDVLRQLLALPNVIVTGHQALLTDSALKALYQTVLRQLIHFSRSEKIPFEVKLDSEASTQAG